MIDSINGTIVSTSEEAVQALGDYLRTLTSLQSNLDFLDTLFPADAGTVSEPMGDLVLNRVPDSPERAALMSSFTNPMTCRQTRQRNGEFQSSGSPQKMASYYCTDADVISLSGSETFVVSIIDNVPGSVQTHLSRPIRVTGFVTAIAALLYFDKARDISVIRKTLVEVETEYTLSAKTQIMEALSKPSHIVFLCGGQEVLPTNNPVVGIAVHPDTPATIIPQKTTSLAESHSNIWDMSVSPPVIETGPFLSERSYLFTDHSSLTSQGWIRRLVGTDFDLYEKVVSAVSSDVTILYKAFDGVNNFIGDAYISSFGVVTPYDSINNAITGTAYTSNATYTYNNTIVSNDIRTESYEGGAVTHFSLFEYQFDRLPDRTLIGHIIVPFTVL